MCVFIPVFTAIENVSYSFLAQACLVMFSLKLTADDCMTVEGMLHSPTFSTGQCACLPVGKTDAIGG